MPNRIRGDAELAANGTRYIMRLTLGALAEIEDGLGIASLGEIGARLKSLATSDIAVVASALLRGGGHNLSADDVMALDADLGAIVRTIAEAFTSAGLADAERQSAVGIRQSNLQPDCRLPIADCRRNATETTEKPASPLAGAASSNSASA
jgi:hypothetical protein